MLENHLSQDDDWASRRQIVIEQQVGWIARQLLVGARTLDIGCGPGFTPTCWRSVDIAVTNGAIVIHTQRLKSDPGESALLIQESLWSLLRQLWKLKSCTSRE